MYKLTTENEYLVKNNYNLVRRVIKDKFSVYHEWYDDMFQEGVIGLIRAAAKHKEGGAAQFSTYAYFCIKNEIQKFVSECTDTIRVPVSVGLAINGIRLVEEREGTDDEKDYILKHNQISKEMLEAGRTALATVSIDDVNDEGLLYKDMLPCSDLEPFFDVLTEEHEAYCMIYKWFNDKYPENNFDNRVYVSYLLLYEAQRMRVSDVNATLTQQYKISRSELREIVKFNHERLRKYFEERGLFRTVSSSIVE